MAQESEILKKLREAVLEFDAEAAEKWAAEAMQAGVDPLAAADILTGAIRQIGEDFGRGDIFLPELVAAANAMKRAMPIVEEGLKKAGKQQTSAGLMVLGTVEGDIHDIGKAIVAALFTAAGFRLVDLGVNVPAARFVAAVKEHHPNILAMSALLTTTAPQQKAVIESLKEAGLRDKVKVIVGGGAITPEFAKQVGADGYGAHAYEGVEVALQLLKAG